jgi:[acyl-carrier-protein] S-malonyltransferase
MIAFLFPGQGSQKPGMGAPWTDHPSWGLVAEASEAAERDVAALLLEADEDELRDTRNAQLATFVLSMVVLDAVERLGVEPGVLAGHSLGEYSALTAAGAVELIDAVRLVAERGEAMQVAAEEREGTMAVVLGLDDDDVEAACSRADDDVWVANHNAPGQVVIAGVPEGVDQAGAIAKELGAKRVVSITVGGAFHTPLMGSAKDRLRKALGQVEWRDADRPVVANVDARPHTAAEEWASLLTSQLLSPVRFRQSLLTLEKLGATRFLEIGPGTAVTAMAKRTVDGTCLSISAPDGLDALLEELAGPADLEPAGEQVHLLERLVTTPVAGTFRGDRSIRRGDAITAGDVLGDVSGTQIRSGFTGLFGGLLALEGQRVGPSEPVAWLRLP